MKKKLLSIFLVFAVILSFAACGKSDKSSAAQTTYDMDDFGVLYTKTQKMFAKESADFTMKELSSDKAYSLYKKCSSKTGLPFNQKITLTGFKSESDVGFTIESSNGKHAFPCYFKDGDPNLSMFIGSGDQITVTGTISKDYKSYGVLSDCKVTSPKNITPKFNDNIDDVIDSDSTCSVIEGTVSDVVSLDDFENMIDTMGMSEYEHEDYYFDNVLYLTTDDHLIFVFYDPKITGEVKAGDKIATLGSVDPLFELQKADGTSQTMWGLAGNVYDIYVFDN